MESSFLVQLDQWIQQLQVPSSLLFAVGVVAFCLFLLGVREIVSWFTKNQQVLQQLDTIKSELNEIKLRLDKQIQTEIDPGAKKVSKFDVFDEKESKKKAQFPLDL
ncbi:MAG: hypothetical protein AB8E15_04380 [Bdellovibrionales bacterium]